MEHAGTRPAPIQRAALAAAAAPEPRSRPNLRLLLRRGGLEPLWRLLACALAIAAGWAGLWLRAPFSSAARHSARREAFEARAAARVVATLGSLKGPFVKAGQFAANRHDLLPASITVPLAALRDRVPPLPFGEVRAAVERELGAPLAELFAEFEPSPLGAASIAQVHRARLPGGEAVAVKVQYPWLEASLSADLAWVGAAARVFARRHAAVDRERLFAEFAAGLREELDFTREARVAAEIAANLAHDPRVVVPRVLASHSSRRVLTMSYAPAVRIDDRAGLARLGVAPRAVLEILARAYAKQVFVDGLFHADPHPGNLFVLDEPGAAARPRLLFVDFGLSRRLDPDLRREMRLGIYALLQRDEGAFLAGMQRMGMIAPGAREGVARAVGEMFRGIAGRGGPLGVPAAQVLSLKDQAKALLQQTPGLQLPNDLLLFAKTLSYVFALGAELDPEADLMQLSLPYLLQFLAGPPAGVNRAPGATDAGPGAG
ncbi:MAG TPA: AarF/UbiB family protein [Myxococcota bacterium]|jgi:ubiquinone biosynthesis protein